MNLVFSLFNDVRFQLGGKKWLNISLDSEKANEVNEIFVFGWFFFPLFSSQMNLHVFVIYTKSRKQPINLGICLEQNWRIWTAFTALAVFYIVKFTITYHITIPKQYY